MNQDYECPPRRADNTKSRLLPPSPLPFSWLVLKPQGACSAFAILTPPIPRSSDLAIPVSRSGRRHLVSRTGPPRSPEAVSIPEFLFGTGGHVMLHILDNLPTSCLHRPFCPISHVMAMAIHCSPVPKTQLPPNTAPAQFVAGRFSRTNRRFQVPCSSPSLFLVLAEQPHVLLVTTAS